MRIFVNGAPRQARDGLTLDDLLIELGLKERRVAVALNHDVVPRADHPTVVVREDDRVEIVHAVQGG